MKPTMYLPVARTLAAIALAGGVSLAAQAQLLYADGVLAVVDGEVITNFELRQEVQPEVILLQKRYRAGELTQRELEDELERVAQDGLNQLIEEELLYAEFTDRGYEMPRKILVERMNSIIREHAGGDREAFLRQLEERGSTLEEFEERVARYVATDLMLSEFVRRAALVSPTEIREHYAANRQRYSEPAAAELEMVMIPGTDDSAREVLGQVKKALADGTSLEEAAADADVGFKVGRYAISEAGEGDLQSLRAEFLEPVKTMKPGELSDPIEIEEGVVLIRMRERTDPGIRELDDDLRDVIREKLHAEKLEASRREFMEEVRKRHFVRRTFGDKE